MEAIQTEHEGKYQIEIFQDEDAQSPEDWCQTGEVVNLTSHDRFDSVEVLQRFYRLRKRLVVYIEDGQWENRYLVAEEGDTQERADGLAKIWSQYYLGEVYGFVITNTETDEEVDSCWSFYGLAYGAEAGRTTAQHMVARDARQQREFDRKYRVGSALLDAQVSQMIPFH